MAAATAPPPQPYPQNGVQRGNFEPDNFDQGFEPGFEQPGYQQQGFPPQDYAQQGFQQQGFEQQGFQQQGFQPPPPALPPPPTGQSPMYGAPPPPGPPGSSGPPALPEPNAVSDTIDRMLRPQGLFQQRPYGGQGGAFGPQGQFSSQGQFGPPGQVSPPSQFTQGQYGAPPDQYGPDQYGQTSQYGPDQYGQPSQYGAPDQYGPPAWPGQPGAAPGAPPGMYGPGGSDTLPRGMGRVPGAGGPLSRMPRPGRRLIPGIIAVAVAALVVVGVVVVLQSMRGNTSSPPATAPSSTPKAGAKGPASNRAQQQAATLLAGLLAQSGADRGDVIDAVVNVQECGKTLAQDEATLDRAANNRRTLLTRLGSLTGRSTLPPAMVSALTSAWQASAQADSDLAKWAGDEIGHGCHKKTVQNDPNYQASLGPDNQATTQKQAFTALWNPIARRDGLTTYQWEQI
jgi:hypothetical protein